MKNMADISDNELREELKLLTGKDTGPVTDTTRPLLQKKLTRLRDGTKSVSKAAAKPGTPVAAKKTTKVQQQKEKKASAAASTSFGFSSDEDLDWDTNTRANVAKSSTKKASTPTRRSTSAKQIVTVSESVVSSVTSSASSVSKNGPQKPAATSKKKVVSEDQLKKLNNEEIQSQLYELTGKRFPVSDSTRNSLVKKLSTLLASGDSTAANSSGHVKQKESAPIPVRMETHFSEDDKEEEEEMMDYETSPDVSIPTPARRPIMVSNSVNTSSFLDVTQPDLPDDDPDCIVMPAPTRRSVISKFSETQITSTCQDRDSPIDIVPSQLPSPNLSSTRRSFVPSSAVVREPVVNPRPVQPRPLPPSPPRSVFARRPLRTSPTNFMTLNQDITPKPTTRLSDFAKSFASNKTVQPNKPDYATRYSTGGWTIDPDFKKEKVAKDANMRNREKGKHSSHFYSKTLLILLLIFLSSVAAVYLYQRLTAPIPLEKVFQSVDDYESLLSTEDNQLSCSDCVTAGMLGEASSLIRTLKLYLADHAGWFECKKLGFTDRRVQIPQAKNAMNDLHGLESRYVWDTAMRLIIRNPHWNIKLYGENENRGISAPNDIVWIEAEEASKPLSCVLAGAMTRLVTAIIAVIVVISLGYLGFMYGKYRKRYAEQQEEQLYDLIENIIDLLKAQHAASRENPSEKPYLAISHVHDTLISPQDRSRMSALWDKSVKFIRDKETRVREEEQQIGGEEYLVWRWLQSIDTQAAAATVVRGKFWQGSALGGATKLKFQPTQFLKIRGMFDVYSEIGTEWPQQIEDAILEKLGDKHGAVHIAVDTDSDENRVYVKFETNKRAGKAFETLNGAYFSGQCVNCKFMTAAKYHQKFPHSQYTTALLSPSNTQKLSLQGSRGGNNSNIYPSLNAFR